MIERVRLASWSMLCLIVFELIGANTVVAQSRIKDPIQMTYSQQQAWKDIEQFLPRDFHLSPDHLPTEEWWAWQGHNIHLDTFRNPQAQIKVILFHGVGTNGRQLNLVLGGQLAKRGYEVIAIDLPGYGMTQVGAGINIAYDDWVQAGNQLIINEQAHDERPIVLYGLSAGGMLAYDVAAENKHIKAIAGMTFLDPQNSVVRDQISLNKWMGRVGSSTAHWTAKSPFKNTKIPIRWVSKMSALVNNPQALDVFLADKSSAGNMVSVAFLDSYLNHTRAIQPEDFNLAPILLTQPEKDRWTPLALSELFLKRIQHVPVKTVILKNAGHYPLEQPGLNQMVNAIDAFYKANANH